MVKLIVLTEEQKNGLMDLKESFTGQFNKHCDFDIRPLENNLFFLPPQVLNDPDFAEFYQYVLDNKDENINIEDLIQDVVESDII